MHANLIKAVATTNYIKGFYLTGQIIAFYARVTVLKHVHIDKHTFPDE